MTKYIVELTPEERAQLVALTTRGACKARRLKRALVDEHHPEAAVVRVVLDNLNTHQPASLHEAFAPAEARRILRRLEFHHTPKHASWLNQTEIEFSVLTPGPAHPRPGDLGAQRGRDADRLALHRARGAYLTAPPLPRRISRVRY